jgi:predicted HicB family RNase H-like nuclease
MKNTLHYKGYIGSIEYSKDDSVFHGKLLGLQKHLILYEGKDKKELTQYFHKAVDDFFQTCKEMGWKLEKPFEGTPKKTGFTLGNGKRPIG